MPLSLHSVKITYDQWDIVLQYSQWHMFFILLSYTLGQSFPQRWVYNVRKGKFCVSNSKIQLGTLKFWWEGQEQSNEKPRSQKKSNEKPRSQRKAMKNLGARAKRSLRRPTDVYEGSPLPGRACPLPSQNSWKCGQSAENKWFQLSPGDSIAALW